MKKLSIVLLLLLIATASLLGKEVTLSTGIDWMLGIRGGVEYLFWPNAGVQAHAGISIASAATADLLAVYRILETPRGFALRLLGGVPNALFPIGASEFMISLGGALEARWRITRRIGLSLRIGEGYPLFIAGGRYVAKGINYPLGLWPDLFLSAWFAL